MNNKENKNSVESVTLEKVPMEERKSWVDVAMIQAGVMICVPSLMVGGMLAESMSMVNAILSGVVGYAIIVVFMVLVGIMGSDLGVPSCVTAEGIFGKQGAAKLISILFMVSMIGWFAVQNGVCGSAFSNLIQAGTGIQIPIPVSTVIWGVIMLITAVYGINALDKLNKIAIPALVVVTVIGCVAAVRQFGTENLNQVIEHPTMTFAGGVVLTISFMATGASTASDFTRYQKTRKDTILSSAIGVMPAGMAMLILGAVMTRIAQQYDISLVFSTVGLPFLGMVVLILATWTTNTTNAYSAGLNAVMVFNLKENKRSLATLLLGVIGIVLAAVGIAGYFETFLNFLGNAFMPVVAIFIMEYWVFGKGKPENFKMREGWYLIGLFSWILGFAVAFAPVGISFVNGMVSSAVLYGILRLIQKQRGKEQNNG